MSFAFESIYFEYPFVKGRVVDIFVPKEIKSEAALFLIHGGGWRAGSRENFHYLINKFLDEGFICATTDYRMEGVTAFDQIFDIRCGYDLLVSTLKKLGRPLKIVTHGSSAGAHLCALMSLSAPGECGEPVEFNGYRLANDWVKPIGAIVQATPVTFEPWDEIFPQIWSCMQGIAGARYEDNVDVFRRLSPVSYLGAENPPLFFMEAANEHMFPGTMTKEFVDRHHAMGIQSRWKEYPNMEHGFFYNQERRQQREAFKDFVEFAHTVS